MPRSCHVLSADDCRELQYALFLLAMVACVPVLVWWVQRRDLTLAADGVATFKSSLSEVRTLEVLVWANLALAKFAGADVLAAFLYAGAPLFCCPPSHVVQIGCVQHSPMAFSVRCSLAFAVLLAN